MEWLAGVSVAVKLVAAWRFGVSQLPPDGAPVFFYLLPARVAPVWGCAVAELIFSPRSQTVPVENSASTLPRCGSRSSARRLVLPARRAFARLAGLWEVASHIFWRVPSGFPESRRRPSP